MIELPEIQATTQGPNHRPDHPKMPRRPIWKLWPGQFVRFGSVGLLNTLLDILLFNAFLWLFPTTHTILILLFNSLAYAIGAVNSFFLNKYWTFGSRQKTTWGEVQRFTLTTLVGVVCNDILIWLAGNLFHSFISNASLATNISKVFAIAGTVFISFFGMRLWVFVKKPQHSAALARVISAHLSYPNLQPLDQQCPFCQNRYGISCSCMEIASQSTQQLRQTNKIKKVRLVNNHM